MLVQHDDGLVSDYFHLKPGSVVVNVGDRVTAGERLASVGNSRGSQVPHLHFEIIDVLPPASANGLPYAFTASKWRGKLIPNNCSMRSKDEPGIPSIQRDRLRINMSCRSPTR